MADDAASARSWSGSGCSCAAGDHYEFANDLLQECVHAALPPALAAGLPPPGRRPDQRPARGDGRARVRRRRRAAGRAGLAAGRRGSPSPGRGRGRPRPARPVARRRDVVRAGPGRGRCWPAAAVHEARTDFAAALADVERGPGAGPDDRRPPAGDGGAARPGRRRRRRTRAPRRRAGRARWRPGCGWPPTSATGAAEADFSSRLAILDASRLRLTTALARAERSVARARAAGSEDALMLALDGLKTVLAYLGDPEPAAARWSPSWSRCVRRARRHLAAAMGGVRVVVRGRRRGAAGRRAGHGRRGDRAQPAQRLPGVRRLPALRTTGGSPGWPATSTRRAGSAGRPSRRPRRSTTRGGTPSRPGLLAATLIETGDPAEAEAVARRGLALGETAMAGGRLRCLAAVAALGDGDGPRRGHPAARRGRVPARPRLGHRGRRATCCSAGPTVLARRDPGLLAATWPSRCVRTGDAGARHGTAVTRHAAQIRSSTSSAARAAPSVGHRQVVGRRLRAPRPARRRSGRGRPRR